MCAPPSPSLPPTTTNFAWPRHASLRLVPPRRNNACSSLRGLRAGFLHRLPPRRNACKLPSPSRVKGWLPSPPPPTHLPTHPALSCALNKALTRNHCNRVGIARGENRARSPSIATSSCVRPPLPPPALLPLPHKIVQRIAPRTVPALPFPRKISRRTGNHPSAAAPHHLAGRPARGQTLKGFAAAAGAVAAAAAAAEPASP